METRYKIIEAGSARVLENLVNEYLDKGWTLAAPMVVVPYAFGGFEYPFKFFQTMTFLDMVSGPSATLLNEEASDAASLPMTQ